MRQEALAISAKVGGLPVVKSIEEAVERLKRDPRSAASVFAEIGPWEGETAEELLALLADARHQGGQRPVPEL